MVIVDWMWFTILIDNGLEWYYAMIKIQYINGRWWFTILLNHSNKLGLTCVEWWNKKGILYQNGNSSVCDAVGNEQW